ADMNLLGRIFRGVGVVALTVLVLLLVNVGVHRLRGPSAAQAAALGALAEVNARPAGGANAFPALWVMRYDVADTQIESITATDVSRAKSLYAAGESFDAVIPEDRRQLAEPDDTDPALGEVLG